MPATKEQIRERMKAEPFAPDPMVANSEARIARAAEYAAFYLGEIEGHLRHMADRTDDNLASARKAAGNLDLIREMLPTLLGKQ